MNISIYSSDECYIFTQIFLKISINISEDEVPVYMIDAIINA